MMVWFRIENKEGKKTLIHNPEGLDATITKGICWCKIFIINLFGLLVPKKMNLYSWKCEINVIALFWC